MQLGGRPQAGEEEEEDSEAARCVAAPLPSLQGRIIVLEGMQMITTPRAWKLAAISGSGGAKVLDNFNLIEKQKLHWTWHSMLSKNIINIPATTRNRTQIALNVMITTEARMVLNSGRIGTACNMVEFQNHSLPRVCRRAGLTISGTC